MAEQSEEKTLPATDKKLQDARRKGQVSHSKDFVSGIVFVAATGYLLSSWAGIADQLHQLVDIVGSAPGRPLAEVWDQAASPVVRAILETAVSLFVVTVAASLVSGIAATLGPVFAFEALTPKLDNINPMKGLKRIASLRNLTEILKSLVKMAIMMSMFFYILYGAINPLFETPACGPGCVGPIVLAVVKVLAAAAAVVFVAIGLIDLIIQRRLFLREMRMSHSEIKREYKDMEGDPHVRGEQRRLRRELAGSKTRVGLRNAVIAIGHGGHLVGLRYVSGETTVPFVVCKARGEAAAKMIAEARRLAIPIVEDADLTMPLFGHPLGHPIRPDLFDRVARALIATSVATSQ